MCARIELYVVLAAAVIALGAAGCPMDFEPVDVEVPPAVPPEVPGPPGAPDAGPSGPSGPVEKCSWPFAVTNFDPCDVRPSGALMIAGGEHVLDGDEGVLIAPGLRVLSVTSMNVPAGSILRIAGNDALAIAVHGDAVIAGRIIVEAGARGGGECGSGAGGLGEASGDDGGGGGGGGGAFGANGGDGGDGGGQHRGGKGERGRENGSTALSPIFGGCPGGPGANTGGGEGGGGGGALELAVRGRARVTGVIDASGRGGAGGDRERAGGGGGGSGGALLIEAARVEIEAGSRVCANGGFGGSGATDGQGSDGLDGTCLFGQFDARHGNDDGAGGAGGWLARPNGEPGKRGDDDAGGGGGGGGSAGRIRIRGHEVRSIDQAALVTPLPVP